MAMTSSTPPQGRPARPRRSSWTWAVAALALFAAGAASWAGVRHAHREQLANRLLASFPDAVVADPSLVRFAVGEARPLFASHCAVCHGQDMKGTRSVGAPNLTDQVWLYGDGSVYDIERTILYGVRSGLSKTHNVTDMPGYGLRGHLSSAEIDSVVQYLLKLNGRPHQGEAAEEGRALYYGKADCGDCHGSDARGDSDYGAPDLTVNVFDSGGDPHSLYHTIYFGRHRMMPAWIGKLPLEQVRALAVYVYSVSHPDRGPGSSSASTTVARTAPAAPGAGTEAYAGGP
ncbi:MAG: c-type cytochrome [Steroidobacteraceae bacterium]